MVPAGGEGGGRGEGGGEEGGGRGEGGHTLLEQLQSLIRDQGNTITTSTPTLANSQNTIKYKLLLMWVC